MFHHVCLVYVSDDVEEEPVFQYIPESPRVANGGIDPLSESIMLLQEGLASGTALAQFEVSGSHCPFKSMNIHKRCCIKW